jgi:hypothetical protein
MLFFECSNKKSCCPAFVPVFNSDLPQSGSIKDKNTKPECWLENWLKLSIAEQP